LGAQYSNIGLRKGGRAMAKLAAPEVAALDPYKFMAVIGKTVIHPGGRASTRALLARAGITATSEVLDIGCGVATTAVEIAGRYGAPVTAVDIAPLMLERAEANVRAARMTERVTVQPGDICALPFAEALKRRVEAQQPQHPA